MGLSRPLFPLFFVFSNLPMTQIEVWISGGGSDHTTTCNNIDYSDIKIFDVIQRPYLYPSLSLKHRFCIPKFSQHATKDGKNCSVGRSLGWKEDRV